MPNPNAQESKKYWAEKARADRSAEQAEQQEHEAAVAEAAAAEGGSTPWTPPGDPAQSTPGDPDLTQPVSGIHSIPSEED